MIFLGAKNSGSFNEYKEFRKYLKLHGGLHPGELPEGTFGTVKASGEGKRFIRSRLENGGADRKEGLLSMPAIRSPFDTDQEDPVEIRGRRMMLRM